jgi:molybdopterin synthase sulfur carrier subunit
MKILFFASLREQLDTEEERWKDLNGAQTAGDILTQLRTRGEPWSSSLNAERLLVSVNQEISNLKTKIALNDELAFFPPVTGG